MAKKQPKQKNTEIKADMKVLLEIEQINVAKEVTGYLSLGSYVEEILPDDCFLIQMPTHRGYHYMLARGKPIMMYLFAKYRMFSMNAVFLERVERDKLVFAKMRRLSDIVPNQRRECFRLQFSLPVMVVRVAAREDEPPPPTECRMLNLSEGGMLFATNEEFTIGESVSLTFDIGAEETIDAEILRFRQATTEATGKRGTAYRYKAAVIKRR